MFLPKHKQKKHSLALAPTHKTIHHKNVEKFNAVLTQMYLALSFGLALLAS